MDMNTPIGTNALDTEAQGPVGKPLDRVDGPLKVTGGARYAYEMAQGPATAYGYTVQAAIAKGRITSIDTRAAEQAPGVQLVLTHRNAPEQGTGTHPEAHPVLTSPEISYHGQPVAFVVAETFEQARAPPTSSAQPTTAPAGTTRCAATWLRRRRPRQATRRPTAPWAISRRHSPRRRCGSM
jgi:xanthine dehydrogenase YagR molybdenum-binding subunit